MATSDMIARACKTDEELRKVGVSPSPLNAPHAVGEVEVEVDPFEQARAARWLRREQPEEWRVLLDVLGLPDGGALTAWPDDVDRDTLLTCRAEVRVDTAKTLIAQTPISDDSDEDDELEGVHFEPVRRPSRDWMDRAVCRNRHLDLFFPHDTDEAAIEQARQVCRTCPVIGACLDYALDAGLKHGVWGGLSVRQRTQEQRRRRDRIRLAAPPPPPPVVVPLEKQCRTCGVIQPASEFGSDTKAKDGLHGSCKECVNEAARRRRREAKQAVA